MKKTLLLKTMLLLCALVVGNSSAWGQDVQTWSYTISSSDDSKHNATNKTFTVDASHVFSYANSTKVGEAEVAIGTSYSKGCIKFGSSSSKRYTPIVLTTDAFKDYKVTKVSLNVNHNGKQAGSLTVKQGTITIGTASLSAFSGEWKTITCSETNKGNGGTLEISYSVNQACFINKIQVWYEEPEETTTHVLTLSATNGSIYAVDADDNEVASEDDVAEGAELTVTANPTAGYKFKNWSVSGTGSGVASSTTNPTTFTMGTADATLTAVFEEDNIDYTVTLNQTTGGTIEASASSAKSGTEITLTPHPGSGYRFVSWTVKDAGNNDIIVTNNKFNMPASNVTVQATFAQEYAITINPAQNGSVSADPTVGIAGETITLTASPATNYALNTVTVTDADEGNVTVSGTGNTRTFTMPGKAVTVTATFSIPKGSFANPYTVEELVNESAEKNIWVKGYIVGDVDQNYYPVRTKDFGETNFVICMTTDPGDENFNTASKKDVSCIRLEDNIIRVNNKLNAHTYLIGKTAMIYGMTESYYGKMGIKKPKAVLVDNVMTLKDFGETAASDIPGYSENTNILYYTNSNVTGTNIIKETSNGGCSTTSPIRITDGEPIRVLSDVTVPSVENNRTLTADADAYTWYEPYAYTLPAGNTAYTFAGANGNALTFNETGSQTLAANTPYLIIAGANVNGSVNSSVTVKATPSTNTSGGTQGNWQFVGTYNSMTPAEAADADMWALGSNNKWKFYTGSDTYGVFPRRCYMINSVDKGTSLAKTFDTVFGGETTYIELVNKTNPEESRIYTLDGRYVGTKKDVLKSGVYVSNGKKFMIK